MNNYQKKIESEVKKEIEFKLMKFVTANLSFDFNNKNSLLSVKEHKIALYLDFISKYSSQNTPGVYLKVNTCLPVLFSGFFRNYLDKKSESSQIGKRVAAKSTENHSESKNCLGLYTSNSLFEPLFWFRVRSSAFFPWPASSAIYQHGFAIPHKFKGLEQELKTDILKSIDENNLTLFFYKNSKEVL